MGKPEPWGTPGDRDRGRLAFWMQESPSTCPAGGYRGDVPRLPDTISGNKHHQDPMSSDHHLLLSSRAPYPQGQACRRSSQSAPCSTGALTRCVVANRIMTICVCHMATLQLYPRPCRYSRVSTDGAHSVELIPAHTGIQAV